MPPPESRTPFIDEKSKKLLVAMGCFTLCILVMLLAFLIMDALQTPQTVQKFVGMVIASCAWGCAIAGWKFHDDIIKMITKVKR